MKKVIVIVGPTASGKTMRSIKLAKKINGEIINGDSVQIYKELNIGSAKIKPSEMQDVKHHLLNIKHVGQNYSAFDFQQDVRYLLKKIDKPIIVGGTGYYIKSALYNYEFNKEEKNDEHLNLSNEEVYQKLILLDPKIDIDKNNRVRLVRALNQAIDGNLRSDKKQKNIPLYNVLTIYLDYPREALKEVLIKRLKIMIEQGLLDEVMRLKENNHYLNIIGYRELYDYLDNKITFEEAFNQIISASMKLAKKQKTWFKNQMDCIIFNYDLKNIDELIYKEVINFLKED